MKTKKDESFKLLPAVQKAIEAGDDDKMNEFGGSSNGFWYDITDGGYFSPEKVLANKDDIQKVRDALALLRKLENVYTTLTAEF